MKLSTKGRYGLRALVDLSWYGKGDHLALNQVAERQGISENYLEQVFSTLRKAGLVKSVKGAQGGYALSMKPEEIRIGTVLRVLEGDLLIIDRDGTADEPDPGSIRASLQGVVWDKVNQAVLQVVDNLTLADLVDDFRKRTGGESMMFFI
jgi:Rrf2 family transcriptional regulator, cysteine metabolism repressor